LWAQPLENNILEWHFLIHGPTGSPYEGGVYHGQIIFGDQFPFKPPAIRMLTPSGRFVVGSDLCLSMSNFHQETWNPLWSVQAILVGFLSFMMDDSTEATAGVGGVRTSDADKRKFACASFAYNARTSNRNSTMFLKMVECQKARLSRSNRPKSEFPVFSAGLASRKKHVGALSKSAATRRADDVRASATKQAYNVLYLAIIVVCLAVLLSFYL